MQDTNSLAFEGIPLLLGCTIHKGCDVNYLVVKRYIGEKASILCSCEQNRIKYKYRAIDYSLLKGIMGEDVKHCNTKISIFPAVTNIICFKLDNYYNTLLTTNKKLPEYILQDSKVNSFRLETVLQDYTLLADENSKIYSLYMPRWLCFNPVKDRSNIKDFYTPNDGENKYYIRNKKKLIMLGWIIGENVAIHIDPLISSTTDIISSHFRGNIKIENDSKLVIEGNVNIFNLFLKGSLTIKVKTKGILKIKNIIVNKKKVEKKKYDNSYYTNKICSKEEVILEFGDKMYEIEELII